MSTSKHFNTIATICMLLALIASIALALTWQTVDASNAMTVSKNDLANVTEYINLDELTGEVDVLAGGTYLITGTLSEGRIVVDVDDSESVILILSGIEISCSNDSAIYVANSGNCAIYLEDGTENIISSGTKCEINRNAAGAEGGAILLKDSATILGEGSLTVYGYINNGIHCSNNLYIECGNINITSVNNGIKGKDSLSIDGGNLCIIAGNAGLKSGESGDSNSGSITVNDGYINIVQSYEGMEANQITINDGETCIVASDDGINACGGSNAMGGGFGGQRIQGNQDNRVSQGVQSNKSSQIDQQKELPNTVDSPKGNQSVQAHGASGNSNNQTGEGSGKGGWQKAQTNENRNNTKPTIRPDEITDEDNSNVIMPSLTINGGYLYVLAGGDGLDSNGNLIINGGTVIIDGPGNNGNGALDSGSENGGRLLVNGGTLIAVGGSGMAEEPEDESTQFYINCKKEFGSGDRIAISDAEGNIIFEYNAAKIGDSVIFSSPELKSGESYTVSIAENSYSFTIK